MVKEEREGVPRCPERSATAGCKHARGGSPVKGMERKEVAGKRGRERFGGGGGGDGDRRRFVARLGGDLRWGRRK